MGVGGKIYSNSHAARIHPPSLRTTNVTLRRLRGACCKLWAMHLNSPKLWILERERSNSFALLEKIHMHIRNRALASNRNLGAFSAIYGLLPSKKRVKRVSSRWPAWVGVFPSNNNTSLDLPRISLFCLVHDRNYELYGHCPQWSDILWSRTNRWCIDG